MGGDSEYEPKDSRNVTGTADTPDGHFTGNRQKKGHGGEYEPRGFAQCHWHCQYFRRALDQPGREASRWCSGQQSGQCCRCRRGE